jgi:hypothetical protein
MSFFRFDCNELYIIEDFIEIRYDIIFFSLLEYCFGFKIKLFDIFVEKSLFPVFISNKFFPFFKESNIYFPTSQKISEGTRFLFFWFFLNGFYLTVFFARRWGLGDVFFSKGELVFAETREKLF